MKRTISSLCLTALFCLIALFCATSASAQILKVGDIITVSYTTGGHTYYVARETNTTRVHAVADNPTPDCLWIITRQNGESSSAQGQENKLTVQVRSWTAAQAGLTNSYINLPTRNGESLSLVAEASATTLYTIKSDQLMGSYVQANVLAKGRSGGKNPKVVNYYLNFNNGWTAQDSKNPQSMRVQRWAEITENTYRPTFLPNNATFGWAANSTEADAQQIGVTCQVSRRTSHYFYNVAVPNQQDRITIDGLHEEIVASNGATFAWRTPGETQMTFTTPQYNSGTKTWSFSLKPVGASPVVEDGNPLADIVNHLVCTATFDATPWTGEMVCTRRKYLHRLMQALDFTVTHSTYTFPQGGGTETLIPYLYVHEGEEWVNTDGIAEHRVGNKVWDPKANSGAGAWVDGYRVAWPDDGLTVNITNNADKARGGWLQTEPLEALGIPFTADPNTGDPSRSTNVIVNVRYTYKNEREENHIGEFTRQITLTQPGAMAGAPITFNHTGSIIPVGKPGAGQQAVHTDKKVMYYIPGNGSDYGSTVELRPSELTFYGYRRWYNFDNGHGIQNSATVADNTIWGDAPHIMDGTTAHNYVPINTDTEYSRGVFAVRRESEVCNGFRMLFSNQGDPAPQIRGWKTANSGPKSDGVHTIACDLSTYKDYTITESAGKLTGFTEPTLSYRMLFELHPATEIADKIAELPSDGYLENYEITAPTGVDVHLSTSQRFRTYRYHESELGYFYYTNPTGKTGLTRLQSGQDSKEIWFRQGDQRINSPRYSSNTDNILVNSSTPGTVVYTLCLGTGTEANDLRIAKFTVHYVSPLECGPSALPLLTNKEIADHYQMLAKIDWDYDPEHPTLLPQPGSADNVMIPNANHLPWEDATFGFAYRNPDITNARNTNDGLCFYGEYVLANHLTGYSWIDGNIENHSGGKANGYMLYADGTMEPGLVASINTNTQICSGQQMYCSAWIANANPAGYTSSANPIFRFHVQGRNTDDEEWQDVEIFFAGELPKGSGWRQILFPVNSHRSYAQTRVCIYNFATTNAGNDFLVDDIYLFATPLPISAYQATSACSGEDVVVVVKVDYQNVVDELLDKDVYYQGWVRIKNPAAGNPGEPDSITTDIPDLADYKGYYMWHNDHAVDEECNYSIQSKDEVENPDKVTAGTAIQDIGKIHIPAKDFQPKAGDIYLSVQVYIEHLHAQDPESRTSRAGVFYVLEDNGKYAMYLAHLMGARDGGHYEVRFAEDFRELPSPLCAMSVQLPIYKKTKLTFGDSDEPITTPLVDVCPNVNSEIKVTVTNAYIGSTSGSVATTLGRADWLVGIPADTIFGTNYVDYPNDYNYETKLPAASTGKIYVKAHSTIAAEKALADAAFRDFYGYTREEVTTAFTYDLRRMPYLNHPNTNYNVSDYRQLDRNAFLDPHNYNIVYDLCQRGLVEMNVGKRTVSLTPGDTLLLWVFPIAGSAKLGGKVLEVCNEPQWVDFRTSKLDDAHSTQVFNPSPIANEDKTPAQKLTVPTVRVAASQANVSFQVPVMDLNNAVLAWDSLRVIGTNDPELKTLAETYNRDYNAWANDKSEPKTHTYPTPATFSMRYYADKVYQGTNGEKVYSEGTTPNPNYHSNTKCGTSDNATKWLYYETPAQIEANNHTSNPHASSIITFKPIDATYVSYLVDRRDKSSVVDGAGHYSPYSESDANWGTKQTSEKTGPQPGFQYVNTHRMHANYTYNMTTNLITTSFQGELNSNNTNSDGCHYATTYFDVIVVPELLIWRPTFDNEWGNDANWHGIVNGVEMDRGFAPLPETSVIIPELDNELLYPEVTGENLYPMSAGYAPAACDNIYMEAGAHILGLEKLQYNKAYVDMPVQHAQWQAMASPMRKMYSGDFFMPHNASNWSGATQENAPYTTDIHGAVNDLLGTHTGEAATNGSLFDPAPFSGTRVSSNPYAFWVEYYNRVVKTYRNSTEESETTTHTATAAFVGSNALDEVILPGQGIQVLGYGPWEENDPHNIALRLPKQDESYKYFLYGEQTTYGVTTTRDEACRKFAWTSDGDAGDALEQMTIRLSNGSSGDYFFMGNPTMAYVDLVEFMSDNKDVLTGSFQYMNNGAWVAVSDSILDISGHRFLAPMEAILVEAKAASTTLDVVFKASQLTLDNMSFHANAPARLPDPDPAPGAPVRQSLQEQPQEPVQLMTITAFNDDMEAVTYLGKQPNARNGFRQGEDAFAVSSGIESLVNSDFITPLSIYTVTDSTALMVDLRPGISLVPLRFMTHSEYATDSVQIIFNVTSNWTTPCYLVDTIAGTREPILNGYLMTIALPENHQSRYFIQGPDTYVPDAPVDPGVATGTELIQDNSLNAEHLADFPFEKVLHNGHIYLRRGTTLFNVTGQLVK